MKVNHFGSDGCSWCWVRDEQSQQPHQIEQTIKHGGGSVMIWGYITAYSPGFMCKINGIMNQHVYKQILEDYLLGTIKWYKIDPECIIFQQDSNSKHTARSTQEWLDNQPFDILEWLP